MRVKVVKGPFSYGMKYRRVGDELEMPDHVAAVFVKSGAVARFEDAPKKRRVYRRRDMQAEQTTAMTAGSDE